MPKKIEPRWGWQPFRGPDDETDRQARIDLDRMAAMLGIRDEQSRSELWKEFLMALGGYYIETYEDAHPTLAEMRAAMIELKDRADAMAFAMKELDYASWLRVAGRIADLAAPGDIDPIEDESEGEIPFGPSPFDIHWEKVWRFLELVSRAAAKTADSINPPAPKRGRRGNPPFLDAIRCLADMYERHTGCRAYANFRYDPITCEYGGPFFIMVSEVFEAFEPEVKRSNNTIGEAIRRAVGDRSNGKLGP